MQYKSVTNVFVLARIPVHLICKNGGKCSGSIACMGNTATSILLKLFNYGYKGCHATDAPVVYKQNSIFECKQHTNHNLRGPEQITTH